MLTFVQVREAIERYLAEKGIFGIEIQQNAATFSRMSITMGKTATINIAKNILLTDLELQALLAHEVDIHLQRFLNGQKSGWKIFSSGTGYYLRDEEGLAVRNASQVLPEGEENLSMYKKYHLLAESKHYSFAQMKDLIYFLYPKRSLEGVFKTILRSKKGQIFTANPSSHLTWMKDKVYLDGYEKIKKLTPSASHLEILKK